MPLPRAGAGISPRRARHFSLLRQRKVPKRKATPSLRPLRCAKGQTCGVSVAGCAVELALRCARHSDSHGESVHEAWALRRPCSPHNRPAAGAASRGGTAEHPNSRTAIRAIAALGLACAARGACARELGPSAAKRSNGPCGCPFGVPFCACREAQGRGCVRVPKDTRTSCTDLPQLFERSAQRAVSSAAHPLTEHRRLPAA